MSQRIYISAISPSILHSLAPFNPLCHSPTIVGNPWYSPAMPARETRDRKANGQSLDLHSPSSSSNLIISAPVCSRPTPAATSSFSICSGFPSTCRWKDQTSAAQELRRNHGVSELITNLTILSEGVVL